MVLPVWGLEATPVRMGDANPNLPMYAGNLVAAAAAAAVAYEHYDQDGNLIGARPEEEQEAARVRDEARQEVVRAIQYRERLREACSRAQQQRTRHGVLRRLWCALMHRRQN